MILVLLIGIILVLVIKFNKKSKNLKRKFNSEINVEIVFMLIFFLINFIIDCFDFGVFYKILNFKYNSDLDFYKVDFWNVFEYLYFVRNVRVLKFCFVGIVDVMDLEFWSDW